MKILDKSNYDDGSGCEREYRLEDGRTKDIWTLHMVSEEDSESLGRFNLYYQLRDEKGKCAVMEGEKLVHEKLSRSEDVMDNIERVLEAAYGVENIYQVLEHGIVSYDYKKFQNQEDVKEYLKEKEKKVGQWHETGDSVYGVFKAGGANERYFQAMVYAGETDETGREKGYNLVFNSLKEYKDKGSYGGLEEDGLLNLENDRVEIKDIGKDFGLYVRKDTEYNEIYAGRHKIASVTDKEIKKIQEEYRNIEDNNKGMVNFNSKGMVNLFERIGENVRGREGIVKMELMRHTVINNNLLENIIGKVTEVDVEKYEDDLRKIVYKGKDGVGKYALENITNKKDGEYTADIYDIKDNFNEKSAKHFIKEYKKMKENKAALKNEKSNKRGKI